MVFGSTLVQPQNTSAATQNNDPIFLDIKEGIRVVRILDGEYQVKLHWYDKVNAGGKVGKRPFIVAVMKNGRWVGDEQDYRNNVLDLHYNSLYGDPFDDSNEQKKKRQSLLPKQRFYVNVLDRTPVFIDGDNNVIYPNARNEYPKAYKAEESQPHNKVMILEGSGGKEGGKHFLQQIVTLGQNLIDFNTQKPTDLLNSDIRIITKRGTDPMGKDTVRTPMAGFDTKPLPKDLASLPLYDLESFCVAWPNEALQRVIDGEDYYELAKEYNIILYPHKVGSKVETDEDLPF